MKQIIFRKKIQNWHKPFNPTDLSQQFIHSRVQGPSVVNELTEDLFLPLAGVNLSLFSLPYKSKGSINLTFLSRAIINQLPILFIRFTFKAFL